MALSRLASAFVKDHYPQITPTTKPGGRGTKQEQEHAATNLSSFLLLPAAPALVSEVGVICGHTTLRYGFTSLSSTTPKAYGKEFSGFVARSLRAIVSRCRP